MTMNPEVIAAILVGLAVVAGLFLVLRKNKDNSQGRGGTAPIKDEFPVVRS